MSRRERPKPHDLFELRSKEYLGTLSALLLLLSNYNELLDIYVAECVHGLMSVFKSEEVSRRLADFGILIKYMPFLQEHGFSEFGKGQLTGKMELLKEGFSDSTSNQSEQQFDSRISFSQIDPSSFHDYEEQVVKMSSSQSIEASPNLEDLKNKTRNSSDGEKNPMGRKTAERTDVNSALDQSRGRKYLPENNRWNFKNDDESSWITRIRKLADM